MDWQMVGVGIGASSALLAANAFLTKLVVRNAILELKVIITEEFVTRREFEQHIKNCPLCLKNNLK